MILNLDYVFEKYKLNVSGIIHIGGHYGNEIEKYKSYNVNDIVLFEPLSSNFSILDEKVKNIGGNIIAHQVALGNDNRKVVMNISSNEAQSSSILTPKVHLTAHPEVSQFSNALVALTPRLLTLSSASPEENADVPTDMAKSLPTGVVEGITGMVGLPGSLYQMIPENLRSPTSMLRNLPTGEGMNQGIRDQIGYDYYQPQTVPGEYARTLGEFLPGGVAPGGAVTKIASVAVPALASETAGQIARGMSGGRPDTDAENYARLQSRLLMRDSPAVKTPRVKR